MFALLAQGLQGLEHLLGKRFDFSAVDVAGSSDITRLDNSRLMAHAVTQLGVIALQLLSERYIQRFSSVLAELDGQFV
ncbi:hypothetical protein ALP91_200111 [Pseudomonas savastanoi pv. glycinea]|nr:hypothetical protein ALP91_200111 [Pseudomonas savastanoi pv. glycinea]